MAPEILYAVLGVLSFSTASFLFRALAVEASPLWMNAFKAILAGIGFLLWAGVEGLQAGFPRLAPLSLTAFLISGLIGLNISDGFMLRAYARMGPARTIIVYRFQPLYLALLGYIFLGQLLSLQQLVAVFLLIGCVFVLSVEGRSPRGSWDLTGVGLALAGMLLDATGVFLSRLGFEHSPDVTVAQANAVRCFSAVLGFWGYSAFVSERGISLLSTFRELQTRFRWMAVIGAFLGTFIGLFLWLKALSLGNIARVSAVGGLAPVVALTIESVLNRRWPSRYALFALALCLAGFALLL